MNLDNNKTNLNPITELLDSMIARVETISQWMAIGGGVLILFSVFLIFSEVVLRKLFNVSIGGADELSGYALGISITWALAYNVIRRVNVRIDAVYQMLTPRYASFVNVMSLISLGLIGILLVYYAGLTTLDTWEFSSRANTPLGTPLIIPQFLWLLGFVLFETTILLLFIRSLIAIFSGDHVKVNDLCGVRTVEDEIMAENLDFDKPRKV